MGHFRILGTPDTVKSESIHSLLFSTDLFWVFYSTDCGQGRRCGEVFLNGTSKQDLQKCKVWEGVLTEARISSMKSTLFSWITLINWSPYFMCLVKFPLILLLSSFQDCCASSLFSSLVCWWKLVMLCSHFSVVWGGSLF